MIKLFGSGQSRSFRCLWALEESGLPYEYTNVTIGSPEPGGTRTPEYMVNNPQGKVPTFIDGDLVMTESAPIVNYIGSRAPVGLHMPEDGKDRARYAEICFFVMSDLEQPLWTIGKHKFALPKKYRVPDVIPTAVWEFQKSLSALDHHLGEKDFAIGNSFSGADILIAQTLDWGKRFQQELPEKLEAYRAKMYNRPACIRALEKTESPDN